MKQRYSIDARNNLLVHTAGTAVATHGMFSIDKKNRLRYSLLEPAQWRAQHALSRCLTFEGEWQLTKNYDLALVVRDKKKNAGAGTLEITGTIIDVGANELVFEMLTKDAAGLTHVQILKLSGVWHADQYNRLCFTIEQRRHPSTLVFDGKWHLDKHQQIAYRYTKTMLQRKTKVGQELQFKGYWQIIGSRSVAYTLAVRSRSAFEFAVALEQNVVAAAAKKLHYRVGIGMCRKQTPKKQDLLTLEGEWRAGTGCAIGFHMDYGQGKVRSLEFTGKVSFRQQEVRVRLFRNKNEPIGIELALKKENILGNPWEAFIRRRISGKERAVEGGLRFLF